MAKFPDRANFYGSVQTALQPEAVAWLFARPVWSVRKCSWTDFEATSAFAEVSNNVPDRKRDLGLALTDDLRKFIAEQLRRDATENPRQRHVLGNRSTGHGNSTG